MHVPLFGYFAVVGGFLLSMLFIANVFLPATMVDGGGGTRQSKPKILIDSSRNLPERIVYDTNLPDNPCGCSCCSRSSSFLTAGFYGSNISADRT